jgi:HSP20 family protein
MRRDFNEIIKDLFTHDDYLWSNSTITPFLNRGSENSSLRKDRDYAQNLPPTNTYEDEWSYRYELSTPGFTKTDLSVGLDNNTLTIRGERKITNKKENGEYIAKEYHSNKFYRSFNLPDNVVCDEIHAKVENGITTLFIPKETPTKTKNLTKTIEIS